MKKWLLAIAVAGLMAGAGCETSKTGEAETKEADEQAAATQPAGEDEEAAAEEDEAAKAEEKAEAEAEKKSGLPDDLKAGETGTYGGEFSVEGEPMTLAAAMQKAADSEGPYKISAKIEKVCKKKGCWFTLAADGVDQPVRVKMQDYSFFVPRNSDGGEAVVEGMLKKRVVPQKEAQHYAEDEVAGTDKKAKKVEGDQVRWEMMITAAKITKGGA